jgi:hypothetical protein
MQQGVVLAGGRKSRGFQPGLLACSDCGNQETEGNGEQSGAYYSEEFHDTRLNRRGLSLVTLQSSGS